MKLRLFNPELLMNIGFLRSFKAAPILTVMVVALLAFSCKDKKLREAEVEIEDVDRHYYPVIQGEILPVTYEIRNTSDVPLVIQEIQTSCGCLIPFDDLPIMVLPNKKNTIRLGFNSNKNTGFVEHQVYLYGNFKDSTYRLLTFDTNVVPPADYTRDYEVRYHEQNQKAKRKLEDLVDGDSNEKGYYTDDKGDLRENTRQDRQEKADEIIEDVMFLK